MSLPRVKFHQLIIWIYKKSITKENQLEIAFLEEIQEPDPIQTWMQVMNNIKRWPKMCKVTIAIVEREKQFILEKMDKKWADQLVLRVSLEAKLGRIKVKMIRKVFLASRICKDLMKTINKSWTVQKLVAKQEKVWNLDLSSILRSEEQINRAKSIENHNYLKQTAFSRSLLSWEKNKKWQNNSRKNQLQPKLLMTFKYMKDLKLQNKSKWSMKKKNKRIWWHQFLKWFQLNHKLVVWPEELTFPNCKHNWKKKNTPEKILNKNWRILKKSAQKFYPT